MPVSPPDSMLLPHGPTPIQWRRSTRARRVSLRIDPRLGGVVVTLPPRATVSAGQALLRDHAAWVAERLARLPTATTLAAGATIPIDGVPTSIRHDPTLRGTRHEPGTLTVGGDAEFLPRRIVDHLRAAARTQLGGAARAKAASAGLRIRRVVVKDTRTRWGSCAADGTLMFSWRLLMAPPFVQDYVVGHEVAHISHMNHAPPFWALCDRLTPHRAAATAWLSDHGAGLMRVG